jgi:cell division cycle 14
VINIDNSYVYDGYNNDFGPYTLNYVHKFCNQVK